MRSFAVVAILATCAMAGPRYEVVTKGDSSEILPLPDAPEPLSTEKADESFFTAAPALVIYSTWAVADVAQAWAFAVREADKGRLLDQLGKTKARTDADLQALMNLYSRGSPAIQRQVEASVALLGPAEAVAAPFFEALLEDEDPQTQTLGLAGAARLRSPRALELVRALAEKPFTAPEPTISMNPLDNAHWRLQFTALGVLAEWQGEKTLPLIIKRAKEVPAAAELAATLFWVEGFDKFVAWSESGRPEDQALASRAWSAATPFKTLRTTKDKLWELVLSRRKRETRHRAAVKLGLTAEDADIDRLLAERSKTAESDRPLLDAALFASRHLKAIPILTGYAKSSRDPLARAGALFQLRSMMSPDEYRALLKWVAANDIDAENRANAAAELAAP